MRRARGFTLIELMVAVLLALVLIGMALVVFQQARDVIAVADDKMESMQGARAVFHLMDQEIAAAVLDPKNQALFEGDAQTVRFVCQSRMKQSNTGVVDVDGLVELRYRYQPPAGNASGGLFRGIRVNESFQVKGAPPDAEDLLLDAVDDVRFAYLDPDAASPDPWVSTWSTDGAAGLPAAVRVLFSYVNARKDEVEHVEHIIRIRLQ